MTAVNALHRGLRILRAINDGHAQAREISAATRLPKSTVARMLETLVADGYLAQDDRKGYHVTARALTLSRGYNAKEVLLKAARPVLENLRQHQIWPSDLAVFDRTPWWCSIPAAIRHAVAQPHRRFAPAGAGDRARPRLSRLRQSRAGRAHSRAWRDRASRSMRRRRICRRRRLLAQVRRQVMPPATANTSARPARWQCRSWSMPCRWRASTSGGAERHEHGAAGEKPAAGAGRRRQDIGAALSQTARPRRKLSCDKI